MGQVEGLWNTRWKTACPAACISTSRLYNIAKMPTMQSWHEAMPGELMRYDQAVALGRPRLDWTLRCGRPKGCVCLHAGQQAAWGEWSRACRLGRYVPRGQPGQRRRAAPARLLRRHDMPAAIPRTAAVRVQGERRAASAALAALRGEYDRLVTRDIRRALVGDVGLAIGLRSRQGGRWPRACFVVR